MSSDGLQPGTLLQGKFRVVRLIGRGGMGEVYEAQHIALPGRFAIKVLRPELASDLVAFERFRREARVTTALNHPGIIEIVDFGETDDQRPFLVMEYLDGPELSTVIANSAPMPVARVAALIQQIADALAAAHAQGIVHRDLKPQNIFVLSRAHGHDRPSAQRWEEHTKIVDFGIAKVFAASLRLTGNSALLGTPRYMAPEQAIGQSDDVEARSDQFALAALAYEMLAGRPAFAGATQLAVMYQVVHEQPAPLGAFVPNLVPALEHVILRGLAKSAHQRFPSVLDFAAALRDAAATYAEASKAIETSKAIEATRAAEASHTAARQPALGGSAIASAPIASGNPGHASSGRALSGTASLQPAAGHDVGEDATPARVTPAAREATPRRWLKPMALVLGAVVLALLINSSRLRAPSSAPTIDKPQQAPWPSTTPYASVAVPSGGAGPIQPAMVSTSPSTTSSAPPATDAAVHAQPPAGHRAHQPARPPSSR